MQDAYLKIIDSFYWTCMANTIIEGADREQVLQSIHDPTCKARKLKLKGEKMVDPTSLVDKEPIALQMASQIVCMKPAEILELVEEEIATKKPEQKWMI